MKSCNPMSNLCSVTIGEKLMFRTPTSDAVSLNEAQRIDEVVLTKRLWSPTHFLWSNPAPPLPTLFFLPLIHDRLTENFHRHPSRGAVFCNWVKNYPYRAVGTRVDTLSYCFNQILPPHVKHSTHRLLGKNWGSERQVVTLFRSVGQPKI